MNIIKKLKTLFIEQPKGLLAIMGGFLVHLSLGSLYTYGNMSTYIIQYMKNSTYWAQEITPGNAMWIFGLSVFGLGAAMSFGGFIETKIGPVFTVLMGGWMMSAGVMLTYFTIKVHLALIALSYGLISGVGTGIAYGVALATPCEHFPKNKGLVSGIIVAGFGLGPLVFDFLQLALINSDVTQVNLQDVSKVPISFLIMGSIYAFIQFIGGIFVRRPVRTTNGLTVDDLNSDAYADFCSNMEESEISPFELIYELDFWILWITFALNSVVLMLIISLHKVFGGMLNFSDLYLVIASACGGFCNGAGRIIWGSLNDNVGFKELMSILTLSMSLMLGTFYLCVKVGDLSQKDDLTRYIYYFIWVVVLHFLLSGNFSLFPTMCAKTFGIKYYAKNYGILFTAYSFGGIVTSAVTTTMFASYMTTDDKIAHTENTEFLIAFLIGSGLSLLAGLNTLFYRGHSHVNKRKNTFQL